MKRTTLTVLFAIAIIPAIAQIKGTVTYVSDGDTFYLKTTENEKLTIRVADIDCPERSQDFGLEAKAFTMKEIYGKEITLIKKDTDRYGRIIAFVRYESKDLSEELLKHGMAWHYKQYSKLPKLAEIESQARKNNIGLWKDTKPLAPWTYRKTKRKNGNN